MEIAKTTARQPTANERQAGSSSPTAAALQSIKVLVWDLDDTLWRGTLLEGDAVSLRPGALEALRLLDARGILHSIASRNDHDAAMEKLRELGVADYFLYPQINWGSKAANLGTIVEALNVGIDAVAFIDDQPFERDEVAHAHPQVLTIDAAELETLERRPELMPRFVTDESARRREMYRSDAERKQAEAQFQGPSEEFLASLGMRLTIAPARSEDLQRAEELTQRTHQLNTTGYTFDYDELDAFRRSPDHLLLVAGLEDRYGSYGTIGLALVETSGRLWTLKLLLMSCRVMSRGVGTIFVHHVMERAKRAGVTLRAEFRSNGRNRLMLVTYKFAGFREIDRRGDIALFENDLQHIQKPPEYVILDTEER